MTKFTDNEDNEDIYGQRLVKAEKVCLRCKELLPKAKAWDAFLEEWPGGMEEVESAMRTSVERMSRISELEAANTTLSRATSCDQIKLAHRVGELEAELAAQGDEG